MGKHKKGGRQSGVPLEQWTAEQEQRAYEQKMAAAEAEIAASLSTEAFDSRDLKAAEKTEREALERRLTAETLVQKSLEHARKAEELEEELTNSRFVTAVQQRLERNHLGDMEVKARLSIWNRPQKPHKPTTEERVAERNQKATAKMLDRTKAATVKRGTFGLLFPKAPVPPTATDSTPSLEVVGQGLKR